MMLEQTRTLQGPADRSAEKGVALVMALVLTMVLLLFGIMLTTVAVRDRRVARNDLDGSRAFNIAEAGLEHAIAELPDRNFDALLAGGGALFTNRALGGGTYGVRIENNVSPDFPKGSIPADAGGATDDTDEYLVITSTGSFGSAQRVIQLIGRAQTGAPTWPYEYAAFGLNSLSGVGRSLITGTTGTNGSMDFQGVQPKVYGDATAGSTITRPGDFVTGTSTSSAPTVTFPPVACPTMPWGPPPTGPNVNFDSVTGSLQITGAQTVVFADGVHFFSQISKSGTSIITLPAGANVDIYVSGAVTMNGGGISNPNGTSESFQLWGCGATTTDWRLAGTLDSWFTVYAPNNDLSFAGDGHNHGSFIGRELEIEGNSHIIYDESLSSGGTRYFAVSQGSWTEVW